LAITGQPAASAEAVSPPATEKASGKLLAPKTTTGPSGRNIERTSGFGTGWRCGSALIDPGIDPAPSPISIGKHPELIAGATNLTLNARHWQAALGHRPGSQRLGDRLDASGDHSRKTRPRPPIKFTI
jgi:hypothetical protein